MQFLPRWRRTGMMFKKIAASWPSTGLAVGLLFLSWGPGAYAAPKEEWQPISPEELKETEPKLQPDAAAEILLYQVDYDDSDYPTERIIRDYTRAKIYKPEQIEWLTHLSGREISYDEYGIHISITLRARLTLPDGTSKVLGDESIRERTLTKTREGNFLDRLLGSSGPQVKERFLAVPGAEPGAILELRTEQRFRNSGAMPTSSAVLQRKRLAIRKLEATVHSPSPHDWSYRYFLLNRSIGGAAMQEDQKRKTLTITATNLPALVEEPMSGLSTSYYALSLIGAYEQRERQSIARHNAKSFKVDPTKTGQWSIISITTFMMLEDYIEVTPRIRKMVTDLTASTADPLEKAKRIHTQVAGMYANYAREVRFNKTPPALETLSSSLDNALNYSRSTPYFNIDWRDYIAIAVSMYKAAGLEARVILLPDRRVMPFSKSLVVRTLMPNPAVSVKVGDQWYLSTPTLLPTLPLGEIPWYCEGQVGLVVKDGPEEFVDVPFSEGKKSLIGNAGTFTLRPDGSLDGTAKRKYTGHSAFSLRQQLLRRDVARQRGHMARLISQEFKLPLKKGAEAEDEEHEDDSTAEPGAITVTKISGLQSMDEPLEVEYHVSIPDFAVLSEKKLIFHPYVFRANAANPFVNETRETDVFFPYALQELDVGTIKIPGGYTPEFSETESPSSGAALHFKSTLAFDEQTNLLKFRREYASNIVRVPTKLYPELKKWYDAMGRVDQQEVIATVTNPAALEIKRIPLKKPGASKPNPQAAPATTP